MRSVAVSDPEGRRWKVSVRMLPWPIRWRGVRPRSKTRADASSVASDEQPTRERRWHRWLDIGEPLSYLDEGPSGFLVVLLVITTVVIAALFVLPLFILLIEVLIVAAVVIATIGIRVLFRQPWLVDAVADDGTRFTWKVVGYRRSRRVVDRIAGGVARGVIEPIVQDAVLVR